MWAEDEAFGPLLERCAFDEPEVPESRRAIVHVDVTRVSTSCGFGVPLMDLVGHRSKQDAWAPGKIAKGGAAALDAYKAQKNAASIDGLPGWPRATDAAR